VLIANAVVALLGLLAFGFAFFEIQSVVQNPSQGLLLFTALLSVVAVTGIVYALTRWVDRRPSAEIGWAMPRRPGLMALLGLFLGAIVPAVKMVILWVIGGYTLQGLRVGQNVLGYALGAVVVIGAAWSEEVLFRGYTLANLNDRLLPVFSGLLSALIFAAFHLDSEQTLVGVLSYLMSGLLLALSFLYLNSLWLPLWVHTGNNLVYKLLFSDTLGIVVSTQQASTVVADIADVAGVLTAMILLLLVVLRDRRLGLVLLGESRTTSVST
jgi:membrane protease YdiL (CAAX protease family)